MSEFVLSLSTRIIADESIQPIWNGAEILRRDMGDTLSEKGKENTIRVVMDSSLPAESFRAKATEDEILLSCGDDLGAMYALLSISEKALHIKPLDWWMGILPKRQGTAKISAGEWKSPEYKVRYRSWFINDEVLFTGWHMEESLRYTVWKRAFETILRCGGNMVIPGTDREYDSRVLNKIALEMGLWLTQHHTEILGSRMFARVYPELTPSYTLYPEKYEALWQEAIDLYAGRRVVWCIGFRGQGDHAFWDDDDGGFDTDEKRGAFISSVMLRQMELTRKKDPNAVFSTNLYGELMVLYRQGYLEVPDDVIRIWGDNGFGTMVSRRQENLNPRADAMPGEHEPGSHGIYFHISFYDLQAANHITMLQIPPQMIVDELKRVMSRNAHTLWNINVGSMKPHLFMLDLVSRMWRDGDCDPNEAARQFALDYYGSEAAFEAFLAYSKSAVSYGPHADDLAGDQYYHWPLRALARALLRGEWDEPVSSMIWAAGNQPFPQQAKAFANAVKPGLQSWKKYVRLCDEIAFGLPDDAANRLRENMRLQGIIHLYGCEGLFAFCQCCLHAVKGHDLQAYLWADKALQANRRALREMEETSGRFAHIYQNDCFVGVRVTVKVLEGVRAYLRIRGDSERLFDWEKQYLIPKEETRVTLQSHRTQQLDDDEMCLQLRGMIPLEEAF